MSHTPGPWYAELPQRRNGKWKIWTEGADIAVVNNKDHAALIASAPDLLQACQAFVEGRPTEEPPEHAAIAHRNWQLFEQARAAIEKATSHE